MPTILSITALFISFFITFAILPFWIRKARYANLLGQDINKFNKPKIPELGGICVISGFLVSLLFYVATRIFVHNSSQNLIYIFATIISILVATIIGFVDDILGWKIGLRARYKIMLTFFIALPIMVINAGHAEMAFPVLGYVNLGIIYPLILIPVAVAGASNGFNMIAGYNGLEAGQGIIIITTLSVITYILGDTYVSLIGAAMVMALLAFYIFNKHPAKIFPGDILTYPVGALIAIMAILGNIEKYALIMFIPYFIELVLKSRGKLKKESFAKVLSDGSLDNLYEKWYGIEHIVISMLKKVTGKATEKSVVYMIFLIQCLFAGAGLLLFYINNYI